MLQSSDGKAKSLATLIAVLVLAVTVFIVVNAVLFSATSSSFLVHHLDLKQSLLQEQSAAMEEEIDSLFSEVSILASYSFREFETGTRSRASVQRLLEVEQATYEPVIVYAYFQEPASPLLSQGRDDPAGAIAKAYLSQSVANRWAELRERAQIGNEGKAVVLPFHPDARTQLGGFAYAVTVDGAFRGVLAVAIDLSFLARHYLHPDSANDAQVPLLTDAIGRGVWSRESALIGTLALRKYPFLDVVYGATEGPASVEGGERYYLAWTTVVFGDTSLRVVSATPADAVSIVPQHVTTWRIVTNVLILLVVVVAGVYTLWLHTSVRRRRTLELQGLRLKDTVIQKQEEVARIANRYSLLFENAQDGIFIMEDSKIVESNLQATEIFKLQRGALFGRTPWSLSPERQPDGRLSFEAAQEHIRRCLQGEPQFFEWVHEDADGDTFTAEISLSAIDIEGRRLVQALIRDVSARVRMREELEARLQERTVMLQEIHHRVGNNLQLVSSILSLQSARETDPGRVAFINETRQRLMAIALAHNTMYRQSDLSTIDMSEFIWDLSMHILASPSSAKVGFESELQHLDLELETGLYVGFAVGEILGAIHRHVDATGAEATTVHLRVLSTETERVFLEIAAHGLPGDKGDPLAPGSMAMELVASLAVQLNARIEKLPSPEYGVRIFVPKHRPQSPKSPKAPSNRAI